MLGEITEKFPLLLQSCCKLLYFIHVKLMCYLLSSIPNLQDVHSVCTDSTNRIVSTPAFMYDTREFHVIYDGIGNMISELLRLI